jgi:nucleotide-binding universal stress UspA family protein
MHPEVLIPLSATPADEAILAYGARLASGLGGIATAMLAQPDPAEALVWSADGAFGVLPRSVLESAERGVEEAFATTRARVSAAGGATLERLIAMPEIAIPTRALLADITVFSCESARGSGLLAGVFEEVLMTARAPVLVARGTPEAALSTVVIAWDGSAEAARAARAAEPFARAAQKVFVLSLVHPDADPAPMKANAAQLVGRLARGGVAAEAVIERAGDAPEGRLLLEAAAGMGAGLFVAGGFGHSRAQEFVFGGATRAFLNTPSSPALLLAH